jgi:hypothetical protein
MLRKMLIGLESRQSALRRCRWMLPRVAVVAADTAVWPRAADLVQLGSPPCLGEQASAECLAEASTITTSATSPCLGSACPMPTRTIRMMIATISCGCGPIMVGDGGRYMFAAEASRPGNSATQGPSEGGLCARETKARSGQRTASEP